MCVKDKFSKKTEIRPGFVYSLFSTRFALWHLNAELRTLFDSSPPQSVTRSLNSVPDTIEKIYFFTIQL